MHSVHLVLDMHAVVLETSPGMLCHAAVSTL